MGSPCAVGFTMRESAQQALRPDASAWLLLVLCATCAGAAPAATGCRELGFTETLVCSKCDRLEQVVKDAGLVKDCRSCCTEDVDDSASSVKAASAILDICT